MTVTAPAAGDKIADTWTSGVSKAVNRTPAGVSGTPTSGSDTTTSATFVNIAGTGQPSSFDFTKQETGTRIKVTMSASFIATSANAIAGFGVRINGTDTLVTQGAPGSGGTMTCHGTVFISGVSAGTYTVQGRWFRSAGSGTPTRTAENNWLSIVCEEVN